MATAKPGSRQEQINKMSPSSDKAKLGDCVGDLISQFNLLRSDVVALTASLNTNVIIPATLAIKAGSSAVVKSSTLFVVKANGTAVAVPANTDMSALSGTIADGFSAAWDFYINSSGTITTSAKTANAATPAAALALLPSVPENLVRIGSVAVATSGAAFIGGNTALDVGTATTTYYNASTAAISSSGVSAIAVASIESRTYK